MNARALFNGRIFDGDKVHDGVTVVVEGRRIARLTTERPDPATLEASWDLEGRLLAPGLIDLQVNGGGGVMFNDDPGVDTIRTIGSAHRRFGTTGFLPTLISDSPDALVRAVSAVRDAIAAGVPGVLGIHVEGPFLEPEFSGIHEARHFRPIGEPDIELLAAADHGRTLLTVAPERVGPDLIRRLSEAGIMVFAGHSGADYEQTREALDAGLRGFTHLFNAMTPLGSRAPGMVGAALEDPDSWVGIIVDGHHVHPASVAVALAAKKKGRSLLVSDAMATVGAERDYFEWGGERVTAEDGCCRLPDGRLAGSDLDMISAVRNTMRFTGADRYDALRMASLAPAQALGLDSELGRLLPGYRASFIELEEGLRVHRSWIDGQVDGEAKPWK